MMTLTAKQARRKLMYAVQMGLIEKQPCEVCGTIKNVHAHHSDYQKPLEVRWLCSVDHGKEHRGGRSARRRVALQSMPVYQVRLGQILTLETGESGRVIQTISEYGAQWVKLAWERAH